MISKHMKGSSFSRCLRYVIEKPGARVIGGNLLSAEPELANAELQAVSQRSPRTTRPLLHCSLSLAPGEHLSEGQWRQLVGIYLDEMGFGRNQYLLVRHTDTPSHEHVHLVVNRVTFRGKSISNSWDFKRSQVVVQRLEERYGLIHAPLHRQRPAKTSEQEWGPVPLAAEVPLADLPASVRHQARLQRHLRAVLQQQLSTAADLDSLTEQLMKQDIQTRILHRRGIAAGISFVIDGKQFSGSQLGRAYSLPKLLDALAEATVLWADVSEPTANAQRFEPEPVLPEAHQRYRQLEAHFREQAKQPCSQQQIDLEIAQWVLRSQRPDAAKALVFSPDVQRLKQEQGEQVAMDYLRQLMERAQKQLREIDPEKRARRSQQEL